MSNPKVSAGALRAANIIENEEPPSCEHIDHMAGYCSACFVQWEAHIIDRETGVAELLEAARWDCDKLWVAKKLAEATGNLEFAKLFNDRKLATEQTIAKCEEK